ncbi:SoxR reducing system RseC family protein [Pelotomaculum isophthalicicum JI]|uniref:SoxR reducing system RseC family protein n=1 Tax=Pelotomaculum isophthalicicum JI TaxID=947010 RepID=A0A9X4H1Y4_9FIRM|nr:SoxR reducing system RseC family protein [Pelotomaculum isophthalicicum]MDF9406873.1 SoxR reducing system RseC family protein [Pelotomaculum isophthalicicum JI]
MKKEAEGIVMAIDGKIAKVRASRHSDCDSCGACPGDKATVMDVYNRADAKVGQRVVIEIPEANMLKAAFVVYMLPLLTTFMGYLIGVWISQKYGFPALLTEVSASVAAFVLTLLYIKFFDRSMTKIKMMPVITEILSEK